MEMIEKYLESKTNSWSPTTLKSEAARLRSLSSLLAPVVVEPRLVWARLESSYAPYTRVTIWTRLIDFVDWAIDHEYLTGPNKLKEWKLKNQNLFKYSYERKTPEISYDEAKEKIAALPSPESRSFALFILRTGLRMVEAQQYENIASGFVIGKGRKKRKVFEPPVRYSKSLRQFARELKEYAGLKPHDLRKIKASQLSERGARPEQLCHLMGWSSFQTAFYYLNAGKEEELKTLIQEQQEAVYD